MAYIGADPANKGTGIFSQDTFTGDGSTTTFDLSSNAPDGGGNELQVFVDNVRQQEGASNAYTLGQDGSGDLKRITFTTAPAASQSIFVLNPGTKNVQQISEFSDNSITTAKVQNNAVTVAKLASTLDLSSNSVTLPNDVVNADKIADDAISEEHLDNTVFTGNVELAEAANASDIFLVYDVSAGAIKKILGSNVGTQAVTLTSVSPTNATTGDGTGNHTFTITGTNFTGGSAELVNNSGTVVSFDSVTVNSATQITGVIAKSSLPGSGEPYDVRVFGSNGLQATLRNQINVDQQPVYTTSAGSLGTQLVSTAGAYFVNATDPESAGNVTFELQSGALPPNYSITNLGVEGGTAKIAGTDSSTSSTTTYNFVLRAVDAASNTSSRAFSITSRVIQTQSFTSSGTFAVPASVTQGDVLVVGGGGGGGSGASGTNSGGGAGGGGLVFFPNYPMTGGGTLTVTVGCGGAATGGGGPNTGGQDSAFGSPSDPGLGQGGVLTAKGGGGGGNGSAAGGPGGSGGGAGGGSPTPSFPNNNGSATQPTQPGNSGAYGFGNEGGSRADGNSAGRGGGGGGAGAAGACGGAGMGGSRPQSGGGGAGKAYTIADGTTSVFYSGGGGGGSSTAGQGSGGGGQGGGGAGGGASSPYPGNTGGQAGQANTGGGGGGGASPGQAGFNGGKGVVIVRF